VTGGKKISFKTLIVDPEFRRATWICIGLAVAFQMSGINIVTIFSTSIFTILNKNGMTLALSIKTNNFILGLTGFFAAFLSNFSVGFFKRRTVLVGGQIGIMIGTWLIFIFAYTGLNSNFILFAMIVCLISFQLSIGTTLFIYVAEVLMDQAIGLCLQVLIGVLIIQTFTMQPLFNLEGFGVTGTFLLLGII